MKHKNLIAMLLALMLLLSISACGKDNTQPEPSAAAQTQPVSASETQPDYRITASLEAADAENKELAARLTETCVISFTNTSGDTWDSVCLRDYAASNLELENSASGSELYTPGSIRSVKDAQGNELSFETGNDKSVVYVKLASPLKSGERTSISVDYATEIPSCRERLCWAPNGDDFAGASTVCLSQAYPVLAEYTDGKWNEAPYITDGECFYSPCGNFEMTLTAPEGYTVISTGSETQNSDGTWTLKAEKVRDFAVIAGNGFEKLSAKAGDVTVNSWYYSGSDSDKLQGEVSLKAAVDAVNAFESAWGEYPYKTLDVAQTPYDAGGMEYPGLVRIADSFADGLSGEGDKSLRLDVAHEVAHEWFYAVVGNDQYREAWLDESFAAFGELVYQLYTGESEADVQASVDSLDCTIKQKYIDLSFDEYYSEESGGEDYVSAVYKVGPVFLWKLRQAMGQDSFDGFMRTWYQEHMFGEVTTGEFRTAVTKASGSAEVRSLLDEYLSPTE